MTEEGDAAKTDRHERVVFRREEVVDLSALPSSRTSSVTESVKRAPGRRAGSRRRGAGRWLRRLGIFALSLIFLVGCAGGLLAYAIASGWGAERLRLEAERALERQFHRDVDVQLANVRLSLLGPGLVNFSLNGIAVRDVTANVELLKADNLKFGVELRPLLAGNLSAESVELQAARINVAALPQTGDGEALQALFNPDGIVEPDLLLAGAFAAANSLVKSFGAGGAPAIMLTDFELNLGVGLPIDRIAIHRAVLGQTAQEVTLEGAGAFGSREVAFSASAERAERNAQVDRFHVEFRSGNQLSPSNALALGDTLASITADRREAIGKPNIRLSLGARSFSLDLGTRGRIDGSFNMAALLEKGSSKVEIERLNADVGQSRFRLNGAVGPTPRAAGETTPPTYRYEFISNESVLAPADTAEPPMPMTMRMAGLYRPKSHRLAVDELAISSESGMATGNAALQFDGMKPPGIALNLGVKNLSVAHVKKLWPWIAAESTRRCVVANLVGGRVSVGGIRLSVTTGRLGGVRRLDQSEVSGEFKVSDTEVTTTGEIPHIQNAIGQVKFAGDDVDISLDSGQATMSNGRIIQARAGTLTIREAGHPPVYGNLDIDVAGPAAALAELANAAPMNALRSSGIEPQTLSGEAQGKVRAVIPIATHGDRSQVDWHVDLAFKNLGMSKPFQGQMISRADGKLVVDRRSAVITADAQLGGMPAKLDIVEPIGSGVRRERKATIALDQSGLDRLAPSLKGVLGGSVKAEIDVSSPGRMSVSSDLGAASLTIPGLGWTKGKGIPARLSFDASTQDKTTQLTNVRLTGDSFGMSGGATISGGGLVSARFDNVELTRGDKFRVDIERRGAGYAIAATGDRLDGRGLIKQATTAHQGRATQASGGPPITLKANIGRLVGFNDEDLTGVRLDVENSGRGDLSLEGKTGNGKPVSIATRRGGDIAVYSEDAGDLLRFLNIYPRVEGGVMRVKLRALKGGAYTGDIDVDRFWVVNEPKLDSLVSSAPESKSNALGGSAKAKINTKRARFERGHVTVELGPNYLRFLDGVLRGPELGTTFKGTAYDAKNNMSLTGTFMPAYGLNSAFGDIPVLGALLGNGDEKGLIGVTYKLTGNAKSPRLQVNPLSIVAPGIFRSIFEYQ